MFTFVLIDEIIKNSLKEDINYIDKATDLLIGDDDIKEAVIVTKQGGVVSGLDVAKRVFEMLDNNIVIKKYLNDGDCVKNNQEVMRIKGNTKAILKGERTALNFLGRMSGISTKTSEYKKLIEGMNVKIADTRKTTPQLRMLEKYSVLKGGGINHRFNLSDGAMIKDNHIEAVGSIKEAVKLVREKAGFMTKIEVETKNLKEVKEALDEDVDIIMLDNMDTDKMKEAVKLIDKRAIVEASGNIDKNNIKDVAKTGVDIISIGGLTHSVKCFDYSLKINKKGTK